MVTTLAVSPFCYCWSNISSLQHASNYWNSYQYYLDGHNYGDWSFCVQTVLTTERFWFSHAHPNLVFLPGRSDQRSFIEWCCNTLPLLEMNQTSKSGEELLSGYQEARRRISTRWWCWSLGVSWSIVTGASSTVNHPVRPTSSKRLQRKQGSGRWPVPRNSELWCSARLYQFW